jgi:hypothetical protein
MGTKDEGSEVDQQMVRALAHPLRVEILRMLEKGPSGPKRLADRMGEKLGNVSYHMRVLHKCECIELVETIPPEAGASSEARPALAGRRSRNQAIHSDGCRGWVLWKSKS